MLVKNIRSTVFRRTINRGRKNQSTIVFQRGEVKDLKKFEFDGLRTDIGNALSIVDEKGKPIAEKNEAVLLEEAKKVIEQAEKQKIAPSLTPAQRHALEAAAGKEQDEDNRAAREKAEKEAAELEKKRLANKLAEVDGIEKEVLKILTKNKLQTVGQLLEYAEANDQKLGIEGIDDAAEKAIFDAVDSFLNKSE